jgi:hypothetical protein
VRFVENTRIEAEYKKGQTKVKVDEERFIDVAHMLQRRYDDETKRREVKREEPPALDDASDDDDDEEDEAEVETDDDDDDDDMGLYTWLASKDLDTDVTLTNVVMRCGDGAGRWYWQQDDSSWVEYDRQKASEIEDAFVAGKRRVRVVRFASSRIASALTFSLGACVCVRACNRTPSGSSICPTCSSGASTMSPSVGSSSARDPRRRPVSLQPVPLHRLVAPRSCRL